MNVDSVTNQSKYIDPLSDYGFKRIFGSEPSKDLLIAFLNELFEGQKYIVDLVYNKNEHLGEVSSEGAAIFDMLCTGNDGVMFIIEIQRSRQKNFIDRTLFYTNKLTTEQAPKGKRKEWGFALKEVFLIAILDGFVLNDDPEYIHDVGICNIRTGKIFSKQTGYKFVELLKFTKTESELETDLDKWLYILKNMSTMNEIPAYVREPIFEKLFNLAEYRNLNKEEKMAIDQRQIQRWDNKNVMDYAIETSKQKGMQEGLQQGMQQGIEKGLQKGIKKGKIEAAKEIARNLKKGGVAIELIAKSTNLKPEEIEKL